MFFPSRRWFFRILAVSTFLVATVVAFFYIGEEFKTSELQARFFSSLTRDAHYETQPGKSPLIRYPEYGPYDIRLGYVGLPNFIERLENQGFEVMAQARFSEKLARLYDGGFYTLYHEKTQAGLKVLDRDDQFLFYANYPNRAYPDFESIPALVLNTLLFIENRELLDERHMHRNPAVEWDRLAKAVLDLAKKSLGADINVAGGSTLATQLEKYRHSPQGVTISIKEKLRQMASASLRAYMDGPDTQEARRSIALAYLNSMPLAAAPDFGEVHGLGDGLWIWYGADLEQVNRLLSAQSTLSKEAITDEQGLAFRQILSLLLAQRRPSYYLDQGYGSLQALTDRHLNLLASSGIISASMQNAALKANIGLHRYSKSAAATPFTEHKTQAVLRARLASVLGVPSVYDLDRLNLAVRSTIDQKTQRQVTQSLAKLEDPKEARASGLTGFRLLSENDDLEKIVYSLMLFERTPKGNMLRVQTDNYEQPLDINEGIRLDLGSTAKLRTAVHYLQLIADLHQRYAGKSAEALAKLEFHPRDRFSRWVVDQLIQTPKLPLSELLSAAMERDYSASPGESFFTGGGLHTFSNFNKEDNGKTLSVRAALRDSVNLVFIRLMRDVVYHHLYRPEGLGLKMENPDEPLRRAYLQRFADEEGKVFLRYFYAKYQGKASPELMSLLTQRVHPLPHRLATVYRSIYPENDIAKFADYLRVHVNSKRLTEKEIQHLYDKYTIETFNLQDRGYIARIHPLELWLVGHLMQSPDATLEEVIAASAAERQEVYRWLFKTRRKHAQDKRIRTLVEKEVFAEISEAWRRMGYPFADLTPSYAAAIGASGDRPAALAELMGILLNDGIRYPTVRFDSFHFAAGTPFETRMERRPAQGQRVLSPEAAAVARDALTEVVNQGTAVRLRGAYKTPDRQPLVVGGKTGTGDHVRKMFGSNGRVTGSRVISRTATFVFFLGDRHFGALTAYVTGPDAARYHFTSSLPVQVLKSLTPVIEPLIARAENSDKNGIDKILAAAKAVQ